MNARLETFGIEASPLQAGQTFRLPSGKAIQLLTPYRDGQWDCGYMKNGELLPPGKGKAYRVVLSTDFILTHAETVK